MENIFIDNKINVTINIPKTTLKNINLSNREGKLNNNKNKIMQYKNIINLIKIKSLSEQMDLGIDILPIVKVPNNKSEVMVLFASMLSNKYTEYYINKYICKILQQPSNNVADMVCEDSKGNICLCKFISNISKIKKNSNLIDIDYIICWECGKNNHYLLEEIEDSHLLKINQKKINIIELKAIIEKIKQN
ncbi:hypothetical protein [Romboutsia ilealis]|uniref:hypothetical protein n=1 Tax=Romboutsia ilealis TaxID=1115758 RepID=UPI0026775F70|nr:hypothetical protein [Romboutsia ilealis]